jgi:hypothetical protein
MASSEFSKLLLGKVRSMMAGSLSKQYAQIDAHLVVSRTAARLLPFLEFAASHIDRTRPHERGEMLATVELTEKALRQLRRQGSTSASAALALEALHEVREAFPTDAVLALDLYYRGRLQYEHRRKARSLGDQVPLAGASSSDSQGGFEVDSRQDSGYQVPSAPVESELRDNLSLLHSAFASRWEGSRMPAPDQWQMGDSMIFGDDKDSGGLDEKISDAVRNHRERLAAARASRPFTDKDL